MDDANEPPGAPPGSAGDPRDRIARRLAQHPRLVLVSAVTVVFLLVATGAVFAGTVANGGDTRVSTASGTPSITPLVTPSPTPSVTATAPPSSSPVGSSSETAAPPAPAPARTCSIAGPATAAALGRFEGQVVNATTGEVLFDRSGGVPAATASGMKLLTASAALAVLGPDHRLTTRVVEGSAPGTIVLVGGGDPTVSALPAGVESYYAGAPKLTDLAAQTLAAWRATNGAAPIVSLILDASLWNAADRWDPSWQRSEQTIGYQPEVTALMVDGDRANPKRATSPRSTDGIGRAGAAFVAALGLSAAPTVTLGTAAAGAPQLGAVQSQPVSTLITQMLPASDNTIAEMLARLVSIESGSTGSSASLATVIPAALERYGLDTTGLVIRDGSGLSGNNAVPPAFMTRLMVAVHGGVQNLGIVYRSLPVSGRTGTLSGRFTGANAVARGQVTAKTGFILTAYTLTGIIRAADGTPLAFAFFAEDRVSGSAIAALDTVTTAAYRCGNGLSNR